MLLIAGYFLTTNKYSFCVIFAFSKMIKNNTKIRDMFLKLVRPFCPLAQRA